MAQEHAPNKPVHLIYLCGGLLAFVLLKWTGEWIWGYFTRTSGEFLIIGVSAILTIFGVAHYYRKEESYNLVNEVSAELKKVTWPSAKEVRSSTIIVVVMTLISSLVFLLFDSVWSSVTQLIYGG